MLGSGMNLITTIIGFGMSATFIVFVCIRMIYRRLNRLDSQQTFETDPRIDLELAERRVTGLAPDLLAAIPTMKFEPEAFGSMGEAQCTVCLAEYEEKEVLRIMPKCGHTFHISCIDAWLVKQPTCPVCRLSLNFSETKHTQSNTPSAAEPNNSSGITVEHSQPGVSPANAHAASNRTDQRPAYSVSIDVDSWESGRATLSHKITKATICRRHV